MTRDQLRQLGLQLRRELRPLVWRHPNAFESDWRGMCAIASIAMVVLLWQLEEHAEFVLGYDHCWVESRRRVIDLTATQYGVQDPVLVARFGCFPQEVKHVYVAQLRGARALQKVNKNWDDQAPKRYARSIRTAVKKALLSSTSQMQ